MNQSLTNFSSFSLDSIDMCKMSQSEFSVYLKGIERIHRVILCIMLIAVCTNYLILILNKREELGLERLQYYINLFTVTICIVFGLLEFFSLL